MGKGDQTRDKTQQQRLHVVPDDTSGAADMLTQMVDELRAMGAPDEVINAIADADGQEDVLKMLAELGITPPQEDIFANLLEGFAPLLNDTDPLAAELTGAEFLGTMRGQAEDADDVPDMLRTLFANAEERGSSEALAMLRSIAAVAPHEARAEATEAADRIAAAGVADCDWVDGLGTPTVGKSFGYGDEFGEQEAIAVTFKYGRKQHAVVVLIDHTLGGGVKDCFVTDQARRIRTQYESITEEVGVQLHDYDARQAHRILSDVLDAPPCPTQPDQVDDVDAYLDLLRSRVDLLGEATAKENRTATRAARATTVHRVKVTLHGSKPPIWRRLEVPSNATLDQVHEAIQRAFGWYGHHLWEFETPSGQYGIPDPELGHRSAKGSTLAQVAGTKGAKLDYTYDFGDDWRHVLLIEDVAPPEKGAAYPRCVTGRRACPPEDCGGIWGYENLLAVLADRNHEDHGDMLDWLGLASGDELDPAEFSTADVNDALADMARVLVEGS